MAAHCSGHSENKIGEGVHALLLARDEAVRVADAHVTSGRGTDARA